MSKLYDKSVRKRAFEMTEFLCDSLIPETALSVAGLTAYIQALLEQDNQLRQVWVTGEVSSANRHPRGLFFTLQDPLTKAAIIWLTHRCEEDTCRCH